MEAAVSVIVSSMSVIIPAILRALDFGDPFMQQDTVDPGFDSSVEIARMTLTRVELALPVARVVAGNNDHRGVASAVTPPKRRHSVCLDAKYDEKHRLTTQPSDGSLGTSAMTKTLPHLGKCDIAESVTRSEELTPSQ